MEQHIFGVDLGGATIKHGLFTADGQLTEQREIPTQMTPASMAAPG